MSICNRRKFLFGSAAFLACPIYANAFGNFSDSKNKYVNDADIRGKVFKNDVPKKLWEWSKEGYFYQKIQGSKVVCSLCPNRCLMVPGDRSACRSRVNMDGTLYSLTYGNPCACNLDPVEKKPLYHFKPGSKALSIATTGCNFRCLNCQNWQISQAKPHDVRSMQLFPKDVVKRAKKTGASSIAYTYSEATTFYEYMIDTARIARENDVCNLWISNGFINSKPLGELCSVLDAANINLKAFSDAVYRKLNGGRLQPVLDTFQTLDRNRIHFEITNLVVPGYVDDPEMVKQMCRWIIDTIGPDYPLHFLRFFPRYKLDRLPPTPVSTLINFRKLAMDEGIRYVYLGGVYDHEGNNTYCHNCKHLLIERQGYAMPQYNIEKSRCRFCKTRIPGIWE